MSRTSALAAVDRVLDDEKLVRDAVDQATTPFGNPLYCVCKAFLCQIHFAAPHGRISALKCPKCERTNEFRCTVDGIVRVIK